jgi:hypothetical protein
MGHCEHVSTELLVLSHVPAGHDEHVPPDAALWPLGHDEQEADPAELLWPLGHAAQVLETLRPVPAE